MSRLKDFINDLRSVAKVVGSEILEPEGVALAELDNGDRLHITDKESEYEVDTLNADGDIIHTVTMKSGKEFKPMPNATESANKVVSALLAEEMSEDAIADAMEEFSDECVDNVDEIVNKRRYLNHMVSILSDRVIAKLRVSPDEAAKRIEDLALSVWDMYHDR